MLEINRKHPAMLLFIGFSLQPAYGGMIDKEGMNPWEICGLCHGLDGNSHMAKFPKLAGQKAEYIKSQFMAFHNQDRVNDGGQMQSIAQEVVIDDLDAIARHFAEQPSPSPSRNENNYDLYRQGKQLYMQGRGEIPACVSCHNQERPDTPWLDAQHQDYLLKQLREFRQNIRQHDPSGTMQSIAESLNDQELKAVAHYLSGTSLRTSLNKFRTEAN